MTVAETGRFVGGLHTVAVFKDLLAARFAVETLRKKGLAAESLTVVAKPADGLAEWIQEVLGRDVQPIDLARVGPALATGPLVDTLDGGTGHLVRAGLAGSMGRAGFQVHDGQIYEALVARGGVLVAVRNEPRAADVITVFHNCGGGNAAIGAWAGRV
jgi:hypothetical protein